MRAWREARAQDYRPTRTCPTSPTLMTPDRARGARSLLSLRPDRPADPGGVTSRDLRHLAVAASKVSDQLRARTHVYRHHDDLHGAYVNH